MLLFRFLTLCYCLVLGFSPLTANAQEDISLLKHSLWDYRFTTRVQSNAVVHRSLSSFEQLLFLRNDQQYFWVQANKMHQGKWQLKEDSLLVEFKQNTRWKIITCNKAKLVLEYYLSPSKAYQYHFSKSTAYQKIPAENRGLIPIQTSYEDKEALLLQGYQAYRLEQGVWLDTATLAKQQRQKAIKAEKRRRRLAKTAKGRKKLDQETVKPSLTVALLGGGFKNEENPIYHNSIIINEAGILTRKFETKTQGLVHFEKKIPRLDFEELTQFIEGKGFFEFKDQYSCTTTSCDKLPPAIPLRIILKKGQKHKVITIDIWEYSLQTPHVSYPKELNDIIRTIRNLATLPN